MVKNDGQIDIKEGKQSSASPLISSQSLPTSTLQQPIINLDIHSSGTGMPARSSLSKRVSELSVSSAVSNQENNDIAVGRPLEIVHQENFYKDRTFPVENKTLDSGAFSEVGQSMKEESISGDLDMQETYPKIVQELEKVIEVGVKKEEILFII